MSTVRHTTIGTTRIVQAEPGNGTRYVLALTPINGEGAKVLGCAEGAVLVSLWPGLMRSAAMTVTPGAYFSPYYLAEHLRLNEVDAYAVSEILHEELGGEQWTTPTL